jgi:hypothetical protein
LRASRRVAHSGGRGLGGLGAGEFEAQRLGRVGEPAVVRDAQVEHSSALGEQVVHLLVAVQDGGRGGGLGLELAVDGAEERDQVAGARSGGHRALLVLAEPGEHELLVIGCTKFGVPEPVPECGSRPHSATGHRRPHSLASFLPASSCAISLRTAHRGEAETDFRPPAGMGRRPQGRPCPFPRVKDVPASHNRRAHRARRRAGPDGTRSPG